MVRRAAVAGSWYPSASHDLTAAVEGHLRAADAESEAAEDPRDLIGLVAPHAGLVYSGPVAAYAYRLLRHRSFDLVVLVGPSHFVPFEGVSIWPSGVWDTPYGAMRVDEATSRALMERCPLVTAFQPAHQREHSLEMQLPFVGLLAPDAELVPLVMGHQTRATAFALADALVDVIRDRRALLVASSDLSHYQSAAVAARLDAVVIDRVEAFDADGLMATLERRPDHACGGGPMVAVMRAAKTAGGTASEVLRHADSGDVSGDKSAVVGYLAAAMWR